MDILDALIDRLIADGDNLNPSFLVSRLDEVRFLFDNNEDWTTGLSEGNEKALFEGMLGSFGDAPGGFTEELQEVMWTLALEYWYDKGKMKFLKSMFKWFMWR